MIGGLHQTACIFIRVFTFHTWHEISHLKSWFYRINIQYHWDFWRNSWTPAQVAVSTTRGEVWTQQDRLFHRQENLDMPLMEVSAWGTLIHSWNGIRKHIYIWITGLKQYPMEVSILALQLLHGEEVGCQTLYNDFIVCHGFVSILLIFMLKNWVPLLLGYYSSLRRIAVTWSGSEP